MSDALEKLQHELEAAQCALAETEARWVRHDAEHQKASAKEFEETCNRIEQAHQEWESALDVHGPTGIVVRTGMTQVVQDIKNDPCFELWREDAAKYDYASSIALPLKENGSVFGSLNIYAAEASIFGDDEVALLEEVADVLAFGIVNLRIGLERDQAVKGRQHYIERLRESLEEALQAIATIVEMRDPYTAGHQRHVAHLAAAIASHRPYRPGLGINAALAEISSKRGIYFAPRIADACLALFREQHYGFNE